MSEAAKRMRQTHAVTNDVWFLRAAERIEKLESALRFAREQVDRNAYGRSTTLVTIDEALTETILARRRLSSASGAKASLGT
jgi:hypothetical protein